MATFPEPESDWRIAAPTTVVVPAVCVNECVVNIPLWTVTLPEVENEALVDSDWLRERLPLLIASGQRVVLPVKFRKEWRRASIVAAFVVTLLARDR